MAGITGLSGLPRSGKSYTSIDLFVLPALGEGRTIVTNLPLQMGAIRTDFPGADVRIIEDLTTYDWSNVGDGCLLILDEVWRLWPQGQKMHAIPEKQLALLKEHGHRSDENGRSMDIVLITQDLQDICAPVRALIETTIICVKHLDLGREDAFVRYRCRMACSIVKKDNLPPKSQVISAENHRYRQEVWRYYRTHMHSAGESAPNEKRMFDSSVFGSFKFKAGVFIFVLAVVVAVTSAKSTYDALPGVDATKATDKTADVKNTGGGQVQPVIAVQTESPKAAAPVSGAYSEKWHIAGFINNPSNAIKPAQYVLSNKNKAVRLYPAAKCHMLDMEPVCEVDGEIVTRWSGADSPGYVDESKGEDSGRS